MLEIAKQLHKSAKINKTGGTGAHQQGPVRLLGAEEFNLLGSAHYVSQLTPAQRAAVTININFDMIASSNGVFFVQDGDGAHTGADGAARRSAELEQVFVDYFTSQGLPFIQPTLRRALGLPVVRQRRYRRRWADHRL